MLDVGEQRPLTARSATVPHLVDVGGRYSDAKTVELTSDRFQDAFGKPIVGATEAPPL